MGWKPPEQQDASPATGGERKPNLTELLSVKRPSHIRSATWLFGAGIVVAGVLGWSFMFPPDTEGRYERHKATDAGTMAYYEKTFPTFLGATIGSVLVLVGFGVVARFKPLPGAIGGLAGLLA